MPPAQPQQRKPIGRPKRNPRPRRATTVRIEEDSFAWMNKNLPRAVAMADFINAALRIEAELKSQAATAADQAEQPGDARMVEYYRGMAAAYRESAQLIGQLRAHLHATSAAGLYRTWRRLFLAHGRGQLAAGLVEEAAHAWHAARDSGDFGMGSEAWQELQDLLSAIDGELSAEVLP